MLHVPILVMLNTSQIVTPFNALWSHNVAHSCDHATFNIDCCYDILQQLLRSCMSTKTSDTFQTPHHPHMVNATKYVTIAYKVSFL